MMAIQVKHEEQADEIAVWRFEEFTRMGFMFSDARKLAQSKADVHQARDMISNGCSHELALRILL